MYNRSVQATILAPCFILTAGCAKVERFVREHPVATTIACGATGAFIAIGTGSKTAGGAFAGTCAALTLAYNLSQTHTASDDRALYSSKEPELYGLKPGDPVRVKMRDWSSTPRQIKPGEKVSAISEYSLIAPDDKQNVEVQEVWTLKKGSETLLEAKGNPQPRVGGGYRATQGFNLPPNFAPGTYVIEHKVQAGTSYEVKESVFDVVDGEAPKS